MIDLSTKKILITGASSGIGRAATLLCDQYGAETIITGRNEAALAETKKLLKNKCSVFPADLSKEEEIQKLVAQLPVIDGIANCAGIIKPLPIKYIRQKNINDVFSINYSSSVLICSYILSEKKLKEHSSVVFLSSVSVENPYTGGSLYTSSKAALEAFCKAFAQENAGKRIRSNIITPAIVKTGIWDEITAALSDEEQQKIIAQYPLGLGEPEDVANMIVFLLSDASKWITGTNIKMDGGLLLNSH